MVLTTCMKMTFNPYKYELWFQKEEKRKKE